MGLGLCNISPTFIKEIVKKNPGYDKSFPYHRLVEAIRTPNGPRHRILLNLGTLDMPKDEWGSTSISVKLRPCSSGYEGFEG